MAQEEGVTQAARQFGVSRVTVYKVLHRYETEGAVGLLNRPRGGQGAIPDKELVVESRGHVIARHPLVEDDDTRAAA